MFSNNHHHDRHVAVVVPAAIGIQAALIEAAPQKFYKPPYVGGSGWIGIEVSLVSDEELRLHITEAWKLIASPKLQAESADALNETRNRQTRDEYVISKVRSRRKTESGKSTGTLRNR